MSNATSDLARFPHEVLAGYDQVLTELLFEDAEIERYDPDHTLLPRFGAGNTFVYLESLPNGASAIVVVDLTTAIWHENLEQYCDPLCCGTRYRLTAFTDPAGFAEKIRSDPNFQPSEVLVWQRE